MNLLKKAMKSSILTVLLCMTALLTPNSIKGQDTADKEIYLLDEWRIAFSKENRKSWKPEFTIRADAGIYAGGAVITGGVRIDEKRTLGLMIGEGNLYIDHAPGEVSTIRTALTFRRYFHLGKRRIVSFYSDLYAGTAAVYDVQGKYQTRNDAEEPEEVIHSSKGDIDLLIGFQPGIRLRFYKNIHIFLGPTIAADCIGFHLGVGF